MAQYFMSLTLTMLPCGESVKPPMGSKFTRTQFLLVEEGTYGNGVWQRTFLRNGNFSIGGVTLSPQGSMVRVKLMKY